MDGELNALPHIVRIEFDSPQLTPKTGKPFSWVRREAPWRSCSDYKQHLIVSYVNTIAATITDLTKSNPTLLNVPAAKVARATISFLKRKRTWL